MNPHDAREGNETVEHGTPVTTSQSEPGGGLANTVQGLMEIQEPPETDLERMRELLYRIGKAMMESRATGEPLNLVMFGERIDEILYPARKPQRYA